MKRASGVAIVSITEAAKLVGVSRGTLYNRLGEGALSRSEGGIDLAELLRVFGPFVPPRAPGGPVAKADVIEHDPAAHGPPVDTPSVEAPEVTRQHGYGDVVAVLAQRLEAADEHARWLRDLLEQRDRVAAGSLVEKDRELAEVRARFEERELFWARQIGQMQALLPVPDASARSVGLWRRLFG